MFLPRHRSRRKTATEAILAQGGMDMFDLQDPSAPPLSRGTSTMSWTQRHRRKRSDSASSLDVVGGGQRGATLQQQQQERMATKPLPPPKHGRPRLFPNDIRCLQQKYVRTNIHHVRVIGYFFITECLLLLPGARSCPVRLFRPLEVGAKRQRLNNYSPPPPSLPFHSCHHPSTAFAPKSPHAAYTRSGGSNTRGKGRTAALDTSSSSTGQSCRGAVETPSAYWRRLTLQTSM